MAEAVGTKWLRHLERCEQICGQGLSDRSAAVFKQAVRSYYRQHGRELPWRDTDDPYCILVSEIMLQQTQVDRVLAKYTGFIKKFPDFTALERASLHSVLSVWQGLGYNRRARLLKMIARQVLLEWKGTLPCDQEQLSTLPGVGKATAGALIAFAFNRPVTFIETNIRTVFLHFFFRDRSHVRDTEVLPYIDATLDRRHPRTWYYGLMDLGVLLKRLYRNPARKSAHYTRQSRFQGSDRYLRGQIIRVLTRRPHLSSAELAKTTGTGRRRLQRILEQLVKERLLEKQGILYTIATDL